MKKGYYDYPLPNGTCAFWIFLIPLLGFLPFMLFAADGKLLVRGFVAGDLVILGIWFFFLTWMTLIVNLSPPIKITSQGIEIRFYFPFLTHWIVLPWNSITSAKPYYLLKFHRLKIENLIVYSTALPIIYHFHAFVWGHSLGKSFIINHHIKGYDEILARLQAELADRMP